MIARATLALMLACPVGCGLVAAAGPASAHSRAVLPKRDKPAPVASRRQRAGAAVAARRSGRLDVSDAGFVRAAVPFDDGLAYDTPRDADGRPLYQTLAHAIPLADAGSGRPMQIGTASWYGGSRWQGHPCSDGSRYEQDALTAAHATLPFGTKVRVQLVGTDRSVVVTITDRPGTRRRVIDLSRGAAAALGILSRGVAEVALQPL